MITCVRIRAGLTDWDIAKVQKCGGEGNFSETAVHWPRLAAQTPRLSEGEARLRPARSWPTCNSAAGALIVPNSLPARAFVHAKGFASARVKHYLNDVGPITAANALEFFLSLFASQPASTKKVHVMLLMGIQ